MARTVLPDQVAFSRGSYWAYASPWCAKPGLVVGKDLIDSISLVPAHFPNDVIISTSAPRAAPSNFGCGVYGYHGIGFGNYDANATETAVEPRRVDDITTLRTPFVVTPQSATGEYNILTEFYLTASPGAPSTKQIEIGYLLHSSTGTLSYARSGTAIGTYVDPAGLSWHITKQVSFIMLVPSDGKDVTSGSLDIKHLLSYLVAKGAITGREWFNGMALGVEPVSGDATVVVNNWAVEFG